MTDNILNPKVVNIVVFGKDHTAIWVRPSCHVREAMTSLANIIPKQYDIGLAHGHAKVTQEQFALINTLKANAGRVNDQGLCTCKAGGQPAPF